MVRWAPLIAVLFIACLPGVALADSPASGVPQVQAATVITVTVPPLETGTLYDSLVSSTNSLLAPIDDFASGIAGMISADPVDSANEIVADVALLWQYLSYFSGIVPGLISFSALLLFYLVVMLVKVILSVLKYLKQLVAQWV